MDSVILDFRIKIISLSDACVADAPDSNHITEIIVCKTYIRIRDIQLNVYLNLVNLG